ncbi:MULTISPECIES: calcium-binding protein [unclassified Rhizobium]|uniref:calcium-binding protein n=1 Tax=unclassified Rhizobium TaxID=2613769 RepID=UPI0006F9111E|nr:MULTISPECIES: calcium-binding protein [unclassified Rhizobium]KQV33398.1 calcium-binding protein [Rhizobium sp. Root1212]KRD22531.1 calcium-binding protein [Rhizobium sp. Root268]
MANFKTYFPGGVYPDHYTPALAGFDYLPFFEEIVNLDLATLTSKSATTLKFNLANGLKLNITGSGFTFDSAGNATGGTVTAMTVYLHNGTTKMQELTGLSIGLETFSDAADVYDQYNMASFLMRGNDTLTGNAGDQDLSGYGGNDTFIGGSGNEFVHGGEGKDTYDGNGGTDDTLAFDDAYYTPTAFRGIALDATKGTVTDPWGNNETFTEFESFRGTQFADTFIGTGLDETFMGLGGRDTIKGGGGVDVVRYDRDERRGGTGSVTVDLVAQKATDGFGKADTLNSIEGARTGSAADKLYGNSAANHFRAGAGNDLLVGGAGNDKLEGEGGSDIFLFNTALNASTNVDKITDFNTVDTIRLENAIFTALTATGTLAAGAFQANTTGLAVDSSDRIIYETDTGKLYYDSNGSASGGSVLFAILSNKAALTAADFVVV